MTAEILAFLAGMIKLEMIASILLLAIAIGVVAALGSIAWFVITKLPTILQEWLKGFNAAVEKLAESVIRITADVSGTHQNTVSTNLVLAAHDEQAKQIKLVVEDLVEKTDELIQLSNNVATTLENRPCIIKR